MSFTSESFLSADNDSKPGLHTVTYALYCPGLHTLSPERRILMLSPGTRGFRRLV